MAVEEVVEEVEAEVADVVKEAEFCGSSKEWQSDKRNCCGKSCYIIKVCQLRIANEGGGIENPQYLRNTKNGILNQF